MVLRGGKVFRIKIFRQPLSPQPTKNFLVQVSVVPALRKPTRGAAVAAMWEGPVGLHGFKDQNEALVG